MANNVADQDFYTGLLNVQRDDSATSDEVIQYYDDAAGKYDKGFVDIRDYQGPEMTVEFFKKHAQKMKLEKNCHILDVAAGTGLVGQILQREGYTNVDAVDGSQSMLDVARAKGVYQNYFHCFIGPGHTLPMKDDTYDVAVIAGSVAPTHIQLESLIDVIRVIKPGGLFVNVMNERKFNVQEFPNYDVRRCFSQWEHDGIWRLREWVIPSSSKYFDEIDALVQVYEIK